jgi:hypothetical protein
VPEWEPDVNIEPPSWLIEGVRVVHTSFGPGIVGRVGQYEDVPTVWVDFDNGDTKALALEFGLEHFAQEQSAPAAGRRHLFRRSRPR